MNRNRQIRTNPAARALSIVSMIPGDWPNDPFYLSKQIEAAINFAHAGEIHRPASTHEFGESMQKLLNRILRSHPQIGFFSWDAAENGLWQPLFARAELLRGISRLRSHQRAVLLVENLAAAIAPEGTYWTNRRQQEFQQARSYIEDLISRNTPPHAVWRLMLA